MLRSILSFLNSAFEPFCTFGQQPTVEKCDSCIPLLHVLAHTFAPWAVASNIGPFFKQLQVIECLKYICSVAHPDMEMHVSILRVVFCFPLLNGEIKFIWLLG